MNVEADIVNHLRDLSYGNGFKGWSPLDINWPQEKFLRFAERRFGEQKKRVWTEIAKILDGYSAEHRQLSKWSFIRDWKTL